MLGTTIDAPRCAAARPATPEPHAAASDAAHGPNPLLEGAAHSYVRRPLPQEIFMRASPRFSIRLARVAALFALLAPAAAGAANVCAEVDEATDTLSETDRRAAIAVLKQTLAANGQTIAASDCTDTYRASHVRLGKAMTVALTSSKGTRTARVGVIEELPAAYDQLVKALLSGRAVGESGVADRKNVTLDQAAPQRVQADSLGYVIVGYGATVGGDFAPGPTLGGGYRFELDNWGVDAALTLAMAQRGAPATQAGFAANLRALYFLEPTASASPYVGAGLGFAWLATEKRHELFAGGGLAGRVSVGYEFLRESTIRFLVELDAAVPTFALDSIGTFAGKESLYGTALSLNLGGAFGGGGGRVSTVRVY